MKKSSELKVYRLELFVDDDTYDFITKHAFECGISFSSMIRNWIEDGIKFSNQSKRDVLIYHKVKSINRRQDDYKLCAYVKKTTYLDVVKYAQENDVPLKRAIQYFSSLGAALNGVCFDSKRDYFVDREEFVSSWKRKAPCVDL